MVASSCCAARYQVLVIPHFCLKSKTNSVPFTSTCYLTRVSTSYCKFWPTSLWWQRSGDPRHGSMGKGQIWMNGHNSGRWSYRASASCNYTGTYRETKCQTDCDDISQQWYYDGGWLKLSGNLLVVPEEFSGHLSGIFFEMGVSD
nr:beta-galactosidase 4-like [Lolium perenne]